MSISPLSGKAGFLIDDTEEAPIYSWTISGSRNRISYRTSSSQNFPVRRKGVLSEQIVIRGVDYVPAFYGTSFLSDTAIEFKIGWNDFVVGNRKVIDCWGLLTEFRIDMNYFASPQPSYMWTATFLGAVNNKIISTEPIIPHEDVITCSFKLCDKVIITTDQTLNGLVKHVRRTSIINKIERQPYMTSSSNNHIVNSTGVKDRLVELEIEGDFDYWFNSLNTLNLKRNYRFVYGPAIGADYWSVPNMQINDISNLIANIQTGELIRATVNLGASYE